MTTKAQVGNHSPSEQVVKVLESLRVIKIALASRNTLDPEDLSCLEYTLLETMDDLRHVRDLLEAHPLEWDGSLPKDPMKPSDPDGGAPNITKLRKAA